MPVTYMAGEPSDHGDKHRPIRLCIGLWWVQLTANKDKTYTVSTSTPPDEATFSNYSAARAYFFDEIVQATDDEIGNACMPWEEIDLPEVEPDA